VLTGGGGGGVGLGGAGANGAGATVNGTQGTGGSGGTGGAVSAVGGTYGGGGAGDDTGTTAGNGGPGGVRIRYLTTDLGVATGGTKTVDGSYTYHDFTSSGSFVATTPLVLTGTCSPTITEADVVTGGKTIILTLSGDTWVVAAGSVFDNQRQNIINGIDSGQAEATGWDAEVKAKLAVTTVVRTSDTVCTITLSAQAAYNITATETITVTVPSTALASAVARIADVTFTVTATVTAALKDPIGRMVPRAR
jgi:hypothetical protein